MTRPCGGVLSAASASSTGGGSAVCFCEPLLFALRGMSASYAKIPAVAQERKTLDANAYALMLALTMLWGFQQVTIKWILDEVSFVMQAANAAQRDLAQRQWLGVLVAAGIVLVNLRR